MPHAAVTCDIGHSILSFSSDLCSLHVGLQQDDHNITSDMEFSTSPPGAGSVFLPPIHAPVSECPRGSTQEAALPSSEQEKLGLFIHHGCAELESLPDEESVTQLPVSRTASVLTVRTPAGTAVVPGSANNTTDKAGVADLESSQTLLVSDQEGMQHATYFWVCIGMNSISIKVLRTVYLPVCR